MFDFRPYMYVYITYMTEVFLVVRIRKVYKNTLV